MGKVPYHTRPDAVAVDRSVSARFRFRSAVRFWATFWTTSLPHTFVLSLFLSHFTMMETMQTMTRRAHRYAMAHSHYCDKKLVTELSFRSSMAAKVRGLRDREIYPAHVRTSRTRHLRGSFNFNCVYDVQQIRKFDEDCDPHLR